MSDPVRDVEIEDVLSSIRRLVSSEKRGDGDAPSKGESRNETLDLATKSTLNGAGTRAQSETQAASDTEADAQKLVLTPSFRVDESADTIQPPSPAAAVSGPNADADDPAIPTEPEGGWNEDWKKQGGPKSSNADADADSLDAGDAAPVAAARGESLRDRAAELEQAVAGQPGQWEPDGTSDDDYAGAKGDPLPWEDYVPSDTGGDADGSTQSDDSPDGDHEDSHGTDDDIATHPGDESAPDAPDTTPETDPEAAPQAERDTDMNIAVKFADTEAGATVPNQADDAQDDTIDLLGLDDDSDAILDEDALRELVTEIVRQELQGGLGERITRNVRKLVRREIHRALASQELD